MTDPGLEHASVRTDGFIQEPSSSYKEYPRSPLRYPGGKSRAVSYILPLILKTEATVLCSPFIGGASIELACAAQGMEVRGYDLFEPLVDFWHALLDDPARLARRVKTYHPLKRARFYKLQKRYLLIEDPLERAAIFYVLNRSSFSGITLSGGMSPGHPRFTPSAIQKLSAFTATNLSIEREDFCDSIAANPDAFLYLDPPYMNGQKLYGIRGDTHAGFDHDALKERLDRRGRWILSYNDCPQIRRMYSEYQLLTPDWQYGMGNNKMSNELIFVSNDLKFAA